MQQEADVEFQAKHGSDSKASRFSMSSNPYAGSPEEFKEAPPMSERSGTTVGTDSAIVFEQGRKIPLRKTMASEKAFFSVADALPNGVDIKVFAHDNEAMCLDINSSGNLIATGGGDTFIKLWDVSKGCVEVSRMTCFTKPITAVAFSPLNDIILGCSLENQARIFKPKVKRCFYCLSGHTDTINACAFTHRYS